LVLRIFALTLKDFGKRVRAFLPVAVCLGLFFYFGVHFTGGEHGLEARDRLGIRVEKLQKQQALLAEERAFYEKRIMLLEQGKTSYDLADELAREQLQYANPDDLVLFE